MISKTYINALMKTYTCDIKKNKVCNKKYCVCNNGPCKRVVDFKYAKRTPSNNIKRLINIIRGK